MAMNLLNSVSTDEAQVRHPDVDEFDSINDGGFSKHVPVTALALDVYHGKLGCVVFNEDEHELLLCEDLTFDHELVSDEADPDATDQQSQAQASSPSDVLQPWILPSSDSLGLLGSSECLIDFCLSGQESDMVAYARSLVPISAKPCGCFFSLHRNVAADLTEIR